MPKPTKALTLEVVGKEGERQLSIPVPMHNQYHRNAMLSTAQAACWAVFAGAELQRQKKAVKHGEWQDWVDENCEYSIQTAQRYMALAEGVKDKLLREASKTSQREVFALLEKPAHALSPDEQIALLKSVHRLTDGETIKQLYLDFGILKKPKSGNGGNNGGGGATDLGEDTEEAAAIDLWAPILKALALELKEQSWAHLPDVGEVSRETLQGILVDLAAQLREARPIARKGARK